MSWKVSLLGPRMTHRGVWPFLMSLPDNMASFPQPLGPIRPLFGLFQGFCRHLKFGGYESKFWTLPCSFFTYLYSVRLCSSGRVSGFKDRPRHHLSPCWLWLNKRFLFPPFWAETVGGVHSIWSRMHISLTTNSLHTKFWVQIDPRNIWYESRWCCLPILLKFSFLK